MQSTDKRHLPGVVTRCRQIIPQQNKKNWPVFLFFSERFYGYPFFSAIHLLLFHSSRLIVMCWLPLSFSQTLAFLLRITLSYHVCDVVGIEEAEVFQRR